MKKLFLLSLVVLSINSFAQNEWPVIGTVWYYSYLEDPFESAATGYVKFEVSKVTVIGNQSCMIIEKTLYTTDNKITHLGNEYIYYENDKLYLFQKDSFHLLYDYSLAVADTFQITLYSPSQNVDTIMNIVVDSVSLITIGDSELRKFYYRPVDGSLSGWHFGGEVIEKIGNLVYFFPYNELDCDAGACFEPLRCFQDGTINYKQGYLDCEELYTNIDELKNNDYDFELYPNPTEGYLNLKIKNQNQKDVSIRIFNYSGQMVTFDNYVTNNDIITFNVKSLTNNIYFIQVICNDNVIVKQFIKSN